MAEVFKLIGGLPSERKERVFNLAAKTTDEAMRYLRYLKRNAMFGTHTGLPKIIRNYDENKSLISNIGDYSVIDVYSKPLTKCQIGTIVNFDLGDTINPIGDTYVYPCETKKRPMGYMISDALPDKLGVCLVHGVLEVPLYYFGNEPKKDFVDYDLDNKCFKFADFGYPVFNVYQDVDGDWIAIILFGDIASDYEYDGPFAVSVTGITGSTMYVDIAAGDFVQENNRFNFDDADLMSDIALCSGETLWLNTYLSGSTWSYSFEARNTPPIQVSGSTFWYRIAENIGDDLVQLQYGDVFNDIQHLQVQGVSGSTASIRLTGYSSSTFDDHILLRGVGCSFNTLGQNDIEIIVQGSTSSGGGVIQHLYTANKLIEGSTVYSPAVCLTDSGDYVNIVGGTNTYVTLGSRGEIIIGSTYSHSPTYFDYTGSFKVYCWDTDDDGVVHNVRIYDSSNRDSSVGYAGWVHIGNQQYHVSDYTDTFSDGDVIYLVGTFDENNSLSLGFIKIQTFFPTINANQFCVRICYAVNGKMYQTQYGDIVQPARLIGDGETVEIHSNVISAIGGGGGGVTQGLYSAIKGGTPAICITGSTSYIPIVGGTNTYTERDSSGAIVVGSTVSGGGAIYAINHYYHTQYSDLSDDTGILQAVANCSYDLVLKYNVGYTFTIEQLKARYTNTAPSSQVDSIDDAGCLLIELPTGVSSECYIDFHYVDRIRTIFAAPDGKNIIDTRDGGANTNMTQPYDNKECVRMIYVTTDEDYPNGCWYFTILY